tara:strand:- start:143 stop:1072 length:930 start_codon:yes stop_codon:yes gene_type:complete
MQKLISYYLNFRTFYFTSILIFIGLGWGLSFSITKIAVSSNDHPLTILLYQNIVCFLFLLIFYFFKFENFKLNLEAIKFYFLISISGVVIPGTLFFIAASKVPAGILSLSVSFVPMLTYVFSLYLKIEVFSSLRIIGVFLGFVAILFLVGPPDSFADRSILPWVLLAMVCPICYTFENIFIDVKKPKNINSIILSLGSTVVTILILLPIIFYFELFIEINYPPKKIELSIITLGFITAVAYTLFIYLISRAGAVFASNVGYVVTVSGVIWGIILFNESHSVWVWLSLITMVLGLSLVSPRKRKRKPISS